MNVFRTPDDRFDDLPGYPFEPHYVDVDGLRMHYVDEGTVHGTPVLLLHGEPSWSYLYRHMIPPISASRLRAVAPDLVGFGRSDKLADRDAYSYAAHVEWMHRFVDALDLGGIVLVCQDWGSLIGLRVAAESPERFAGIVLANGGLPTGHQAMPTAFRAWQAFARWSPVFPVGEILQKGTVTDLPDDVRRAYDAPFPSSKYKAGARAFPQLVPCSPDDPARTANEAAWRVFEQWEAPFLTAFSDRDPVTRGGDKVWQARVPGCKGQAHTTIKGAGHFLQEDRGPELAEVVIRFVEANDLG